MSHWHAIPNTPCQACGAQITHLLCEESPEPPEEGDTIQCSVCDAFYQIVADGLQRIEAPVANGVVRDLSDAET